MQSITFLIKPASSLCDMRCHYCFYHDISDAREVKNMGCMEDETAHILIQKAFHAVQPGGFIQFLFQGGEPTLAGLDFFRRFLQLKEEYSPGNVQVGYSLQTNGLHLDEKWASFFQQHHFLVGLSMDGNQRMYCCKSQFEIIWLFEFGGSTNSWLALFKSAIPFAVL